VQEQHGHQVCTNKNIVWNTELSKFIKVKDASANFRRLRSTGFQMTIFMSSAANILLLLKTRNTGDITIIGCNFMNLYWVVHNKVEYICFMQVVQSDSFRSDQSRPLQWSVVTLNILTWPPFAAMIEINLFWNCLIAWIMQSTYIPLFVCFASSS